MGDLAGEVRPGIRALHVEAEEGNRRADAKGQQQADAEGAEGQAARQAFSMAGTVCCWGQRFRAYRGRRGTSSMALQCRSPTDLAGV